MAPPKNFASAAIANASVLPDPDNPRQLHSFEKTDQLLFCISAVLGLSRGFSQLANLPQLLDTASHALEGNLIIEPASVALKAIAESFESYLKLIASVKYQDRRDLLNGADAHVGFLKTSLGGLLVGSPDPTRNASDEQRKTIPKARIVKFEFGGKELSNRVFERTRVVRNRVHEAETPDALTILQDARIVFAAYLFATEQNLSILEQRLYPYSPYLEGLIEAHRKAAPLVIAPYLTSATPIQVVGGIDLRTTVSLQDVKLLLNPPPTGSRGVRCWSAKADWGCLPFSSERVANPPALLASVAAP